MGIARAEVERTLPYPLERVRELAAPARFDRWVEPLNRLETRPDGTFLADIGYFGQPNEHTMRVIEGDVLGLEAVGDDSHLRWTLALAEDEDHGGTRAHFVYEKGGSGTVFGASAESPLFEISIEVLAERSLERLERALARGGDA